MAEAGRGAGRDRARFVYVARFGSHACGGVLQRGGQAQGSPRGAPDGGKLPPGSPRGGPAASSGAGASSARSGPGRAARAGLTKENLAKKFDFPIPLNEASKIMKKKKKVLVWNKVYKIISKMLEENEEYRLRLKCQQLSSEGLTYLWIYLPKKIMKSVKMEL